jgi:hypothetical protein
MIARKEDITMTDAISRSQAIEALVKERKACEGLNDNSRQSDGLRMAVNILASLPVVPQPENNANFPKPTTGDICTGSHSTTSPFSAPHQRTIECLAWDEIKRLRAEIESLRGAPVVAGELTPKTVFDEVKAELTRAQAKFPDQHLPNFPERMDWDHAAAERDQAQELTDRCHASGVVTWWHVLREEIYEAFAESNPAKLRAELVQVAAMAIRWIEDLESAPVEGREEK